MNMMSRAQVTETSICLATEQIMNRLNTGVENIRTAIEILGKGTAPAEAVTIFVGRPVTGRVISLEDGTVIYRPLQVPPQPDLPDAIIPEPLGGACDCCHGSGRK